MITPAEITTRYLYGTAALPERIDNNAIIRPSDAKGEPAEMSVSDVMNPETGHGRFAIATQFDYVNALFNGDPQELFTAAVDAKDKFNIIPEQDGDRQIIRMDKAQLNGVLNYDDAYSFPLYQLEWQDDYDDYASRTYVFNSTNFSIGDDARFIVTSDGEVYIENLSIAPTVPTKKGTFQDNFDFQGGTSLTNLANLALEPIIDPYQIGRRVDINYTGSAEVVERYDRAAFEQDTARLESFKQGIEPTKLTQDIYALANDLYDQGIVRFANPENQMVVYGTAGDDTINEQFINQRFLGVVGSGAQRLPDDPSLDGNGKAIIAGDGDDVLFGLNDENDILDGGNGADVLRGFSGNDTLRGGSGRDTLSGTGGVTVGETDWLLGGTENDTYVIGNAAGDFYTAGGGFEQRGERLVSTNDDTAVIPYLEPGDKIELSDKYKHFMLPVPNSEIFPQDIAVEGVNAADFDPDAYSVEIIADLDGSGDISDGDNTVVIYGDNLTNTSFAGDEFIG